MRRALLVSLSAALLAAPCGTVYAQQRVGVAAVVLGVAFKSAEEGKLGTRLRPGAPVFVGERITTGNTARVQLLLTDQSAFMIGPQSSMVMEEYVYDAADDDRGSVVARFVTGAFRFITGKIAAKRPRSMQMNAGGIASIGVRGTSGVVGAPPANPIPGTQVPGDGAQGPSVENLPFQPGITASNVSTALLGAGTNQFGEPTGAVEVTANGGPGAFLNNSQVGVTFNPNGTFQYVPAGPLVGPLLQQTNIPPGPTAGSPGSSGQARAAGGAGLSDALAGDFQGSAVLSSGDPIAGVVNDLGSQGNGLGGILTLSQLAPNVTLQGPAPFVVAPLIQSNGLTGQVDWTFQINTSSGSATVGFNGFLIQTGTGTIGGSGSGSVNFGPGAPLQASNVAMNLSGGASGTVTGFSIQNLSSSSGGSPQPHFVGSATLSASGVSGTSDVKFDLQ